MQNLSGKVVVITGASSGIGAASALAFAQQGCKLVLAARNREKLDAIAQQTRALHAETLVVTCDVSKEQDCRTLIELAIKEFKTIHVLINNAGISMRAIFAETDIDVIRQLMEINFWGAVYCTKFALPELLRNRGSVLGVSSIAGIKGLPARTGYSASKFAMNGFLDALRIENLKTGLHVGVIYPGYTASNIRNTALNKSGQAQQDSPLDEQKLMPAETVALHIVNMVRQRRAETTLTMQGKMTRWLNRFFPRLVDRLVYNVVSKEPNSPFL
ncbi:MAG: SDR family oxidoreductase [Bacteroidia bacterium]